MNVIAVSKKASSTAAGSRARMIPTPLKNDSMIMAMCLAGSSVSIPHLSLSDSIISATDSTIASFNCTSRARAGFRRA